MSSKQDDSAGKALADYQKLMDAMTAVRAMTDTAGWRVLAEWMHTSIQAAKETLVSAEGRDVVHLQQRIQAFRDVLAHVAPLCTPPLHSPQTSRC